MPYYHRGQKRPALLIIKAVADYHRIPMTDILGRSRKVKYVRPREEAMFYVYTSGGRPMSEVGRIFNGRHHTTVLNGVRNYQARQGAAS